jgi:ABC-type oligopeptide transport system substrate-binding subunit
MSVENWWSDPEQLRLFEERLAAIKIDRRDMLRYAAAAGGVSLAAVAAACGPAAAPAPTAAPVAKPTEAPKPAAAAPTAAAAAKPTEAPKPAATTVATGAKFGAAPGVFRWAAGAGRDALSFDFNFDLYNQGDSSVFAGLGNFDPELKAIPDMAERWESNADGSVWTFHMRKGAKWTNGDPVTAHDFEWSWKRQLDPATKAPYAGFLYDLKNAEAFNKIKEGVTRDSVGIKAEDDYTLVATMEGPRGYFPVLASYTAALPAHRASVEKYGDGDKWTTPDKIVSNGAFKLTAWERDRFWETQKNPDYWDAKNIKLQKVIRPIIPFNAQLIAYENDELDWIDRGPIGELKRVQADPKLSKEMLSFSLTGTWYLVPHVKMAPFDDKQVRLAMAHAVDREAIVKGPLQNLGQVAYTFNPPGFPGYNPNKYEELTKYDPKVAMDMLKGTPYEGGKNWPKITLTHRDEGDGPKAVGAAIIQMLKQNLGMQIDQVVGEPKETYERMYKGEIQLMWIRWYADYPDPNNQQWQVFYGGNTTGRRQVWQNDDFDKLVTDAKGMTDEAKRFQMYQDADKVMLDDGAAIFVYYPYNYGLLKPRVSGMPKNKAGDWVPYWNIFRSMVNYLEVK